MYTKRQKVNIDDTRFIFTTNFSGDPERDRFGSDQRRVNVVIPTEELAQHLLDLGVKVKQTKPNPERTYDEPFVPTLYVPVNIKMDSKWPPHIYWVTTAGKRLLCNEDTISQLDFIRVKNVCLQANLVEKSGKKYPGKPAAGKAVDLVVLKKYSSEANKDFEKFLSAAASNNQSGALLHLTALVADLKILEIEINK